MIGYPLERLREEVAYIAYHFHWPLDEIVTLEHAERLAWVEQIAQINRRINGGIVGHNTAPGRTAAADHLDARSTRGRRSGRPNRRGRTVAAT
jgi:hypothetical protein